MCLPALDMVLGLTTRAIELFVKMLAAWADQIGHDEAGIPTHGANLDPADDAALFRPRSSRIGEAFEPTEFCALKRIALRCGAFQALYLLPQARIL